MTHEFAARCGIYCQECRYRTAMACPGCVRAEGKPFWGECRVANCCTGKNHDHCGQCGDFPCAVLNEFAYDKEQGDNGERIRNLEAWNSTGFEEWSAKHSKP